jgi:hypothetical protein
MKSILILIVLLSSFQLFAQIESIDNKILKADSVILISHKISREYQYTAPGKSKNFPTFLLRGNINPKIILSKKRLLKTQNLIDILHVKDGTYEYIPGNCDEPRNSILIYTKGRLSYIDICFHCQRIHTSEDLKDLVVFDRDRFAKTEKLFKSFNLIVEH